MQTREDRERRVKKLRDLVQAGLYQTDPDRLAKAIVDRSRRRLLGRLDGQPGC